jgi:hypothetical protein
MACVISFTTGMFDISKEDANPINPIAGQGVLNWMRPHLHAGEFTTTEPGTEDWGWYMDVEGPASSYLVGASGQSDTPASGVDWTIQIHKKRPLTDKLTGKAR